VVYISVRKIKLGTFFLAHKLLPVSNQINILHRHDLDTYKPPAPRGNIGDTLTRFVFEWLLHSRRLLRMFVTSSKSASNFRWQRRYSHIYIPPLYTCQVASLFHSTLVVLPTMGLCVSIVYTQKEKVPVNILLSYVKFFLKLTSIFLVCVVTMDVSMPVKITVA
jgi:hypothetical protein